MRTIALVTLLLTAACRPDPCGPAADPVASLLCTVPSIDYDAEFWTREAEEDTPAWRQALAYCKGHQFPRGTRCQLVHQVSLVQDLRREAEGARERIHERATRPSPPPPSAG